MDTTKPPGVPQAAARKEDDERNSHTRHRHGPAWGSHGHRHSVCVLEVQLAFPRFSHRITGPVRFQSREGEKRRLDRQKRREVRYRHAQAPFMLLLLLPAGLFLRVERRAYLYLPLSPILAHPASRIVLTHSLPRIIAVELPETYRST